MGIRFVLALIFCCAAAPVQAQGISDLKSHDVDQPFDISADKVEVQDQNNIAVFSGNVAVEQGDLSLKAKTLRVFYERQGTAAPTILRLDARGTVALTSPSETVTGAWSIYDVRREIVTVGGNVRFQSADARLAGDRLELNLRSGLTTLDSDDVGTGPKQRVKGRFAVPDKTGG
ncbi:MAG: LptA/OstA family protein [Pseudomonadota bacterium]